MAGPKVVACLEVGLANSGDATFKVTPSANRYYRAWSEQTENAQVTADVKQDITLTRGKWRVAAYDGQPDPIDVGSFFKEAPFTSTGYAIELTGDGETLIPDDPWPPPLEQR